MKKNKRFAFTLAEVLITLGIIGVVAALTVPTLMQNITNKQFESGDKVFTNKLKESLKVMNTQQVLRGHKTTEAFMEEFKKHHKINHVCIDNPTQCFPKTVSWGEEEVDLDYVKIANDIVQYSEGEESWGTKVVGVQFGNGVSGLLAYNPKCKANPFDMESDVMHCIALVYDLNANATPNQYGKDLKTTANVKSLGSGSCVVKIGKTCVTKLRFEPSPISKAECEANKGSWGIENCPVDNDYWAGAVKACGHVSKLTSMADLAQIANYLYNVDSIGENTNLEGLTFDKEKGKELGITNINFYLWSDSVRIRYFRNEKTAVYGNGRDGAGLYALCVK